MIFFKSPVREQLLSNKIILRRATKTRTGGESEWWCDLENPSSLRWDSVRSDLSAREENTLLRHRDVHAVTTTTAYDSSEAERKRQERGKRWEKITRMKIPLSDKTERVVDLLKYIKSKQRERETGWDLNLTFYSL